MATYISFPNSPNESRADLPAWGVGVTPGAGVTAGGSRAGMDGEPSDSEDENEDADDIVRNLNGTEDPENGAPSPPHVCAPYASSLSKLLTTLRPLYT
ncbi:hypothetical protein CVT25_012980 [Psilocybe cyanescens]|uniref:Uncharacterized protein n=1 Tax=Psilocybe cyanescens TaxID=93625 RepID=A0A409X7N0_PSICY|nr:hypothetical protein CVT25_012980 [Psilocybe cyanescens]